MVRPRRLDAILSPAEQERWLADPSALTGPDEPRPDDPGLRVRGEPRCDRLARHDRFGTVVAGLRRYVTATIPAPRRTECAFWAVSCLPSTGRPVRRRLYTLSLSNLDVCWASYPAAAPASLSMWLSVDFPALVAAWRGIDRLTARHPWLEVIDLGYSARRDVITLRVHDPGDFGRVLAVRGVADAARELNLDLMRRGHTPYSRFHCPPLADYLLE